MSASADTPHGAAPAELRARLAWPDDALLAECEIHLHRTGGPGGQHRNKVASAVRLVHKPTNFVVTAGERRSQHENRAQALARLREVIALGIRLPIPATFVWPAGVQLAHARLKVSPGNPAWFAAVALVLDELDAAAGQLRPAAERLGVTPSSLTKFLTGHPKTWATANAIRRAHGAPPLRD